MSNTPTTDSHLSSDAAADFEAVKVLGCRVLNTLSHRGLCEYTLDKDAPGGIRFTKRLTREGVLGALRTGQLSLDATYNFGRDGYDRVKKWLGGPDISDTDVCLAGEQVLVVTVDPFVLAKPPMTIRKCLCGSVQYSFARSLENGDRTLECHGCGIHSRPEGAKTEAEAVRRWNHRDTILNSLHAYTKTT